jgi:hypothetical protein
MKNLSAVIIDTFPGKGLPLRAVHHTLPHVDKLYVLSDENFVTGSEFHQIESIHSPAEYSDVVLGMLPDVVQEDHFLIIQWDGMPVSHWDDAFLEFDYIGAPWYSKIQPPCVGNGGFSLRSRRLIDAIRALGIGIDPNGYSWQAEDMLICKHHRAALEGAGIKFAPADLAQRFSFESGERIPSFGFHGMHNLPLYFTEDELLEFAGEILARRSTQKGLMRYLENLRSAGMQDLLRLTEQQLGEESCQLAS